MNQELFRRLLERQALGGMRRRLRFDLPRQVGDGLFEIRIVSRDGQRGAVLCQRFGQRALAMVDVRETANRGEVFRSALQHLMEFALRILKLPELDQCPAEGDARGEIRRVNFEAGSADVDGFLKHRRAPVLFSELGESNRRRVLLDPSSEIVEA